MLCNVGNSNSFLCSILLNLNPISVRLETLIIGGSHPVLLDFSVAQVI